MIVQSNKCSGNGDLIVLFTEIAKIILYVLVTVPQQVQYGKHSCSLETNITCGEAKYYARHETMPECQCMTLHGAVTMNLYIFGSKSSNSLCFY